MNSRFFAVVMGSLIFFLARPAQAQVPNLINYQGRVSVGTTNFNGTGQFKFVLTNGTGTTYYWISDGSVVAPPQQPTNAVSLPVTKGLYSVLLGDASISNMTGIPSSVFANPDVRLRVFFNDGVNGFQLLTPDQRLAPNGFLADGVVTGAKIATSAVGNTQLAPNAVQSANIASAAVGSTQIAGGAVGGAQLAAGAVDTAQLSAAIASGLWTASGSDVYRSGGNVGIGTATPKHKLDVNGNVWLGTTLNGQVFTELGDTLYLGASLKYLSTNLGASVDGSTDWLNLMAHPLSKGILFGTSGPSDADPHSQPHPLMVIQAGGNVGIGTVTPGSKLDVAGTVNVSGNTTFGGDTAVSGNATVVGSNTVGGNTNVIGSATVGGNLFVPGPTSRFGLNTTGFTNVAATVQGRVGDAGLLDLLNSAGTQMFLVDTVGNTTTSGNATVGGNLFVSGPGSRFALNTTGFANVTATLQSRAGDASVLDLLNSAGTQLFLVDTAGDTTTSGNATISGSTTVGGNLFATGSTSRFGLNTTGFANVAATLKARAGDAAVLDVLNSAGTPIFLVDTVGNTTTAGTASVAGNTITTGSSTIGGALAVGTTTAAPIARIDVFGDGWFRGASGSSLPSSASKGVRVFYDTTLSLGSIFAYDYTNNVPLNLELQGNGGKVGIGTSTPAATLDVIGTAHVSSGAVVGGTLVAGGASVTSLGVSGDTNIGGGLTAGSTSAGVALNGHTSIGSPITNGALNVQRFASGEVAAGFAREDAQPFVQIGDGFTGRALLANRATGTIVRTDGSPSWDTSSDIRIKHDVFTVTGALETLARLRPVRYHYNADFLAKMMGAPDIEHFGVVAQEFQKVFPDFVDTDKDGMLSVRMDPIPIVTAAAVQELNAKVNERDARIEALEKENRALEQKDKTIEARLQALEAKLGPANP